MSITLLIAIMVVNLFFGIVGIGCAIISINKGKGDFTRTLFWAFVFVANASNFFVMLDKVSKKLF